MGRIRSTLVILIGMLVCVPVLRADAQILVHASESICNFPFNPLPPTRMNPFDHVEWCDPTPGGAKGFTIYADGMQAPLDATCTAVVGGAKCNAPIPTAIVMSGATSLAIIASSAEELIDGVPTVHYSAPGVMQLTDPDVPVTCGYTPPGATVKETRPKDTAIGGLLSNNLQDAAVRLGQLRRDGWRVEWQYTAATSMVGTVTERIVIMAWCIGVPQ